MNHSNYLTGLTGLRAIAALGVLVSHLAGALQNYGLNPYLFGRNPEGKPANWTLAVFGVTTFFALSGFLITYLLLKEREHQTIRIKNFYIRRILRIFPLYYLYLFIAILACVLYNLPMNKEILLYYVFFAANIPYAIDKAMHLIGHYWSIGVEEQFYLFFPFLVKYSDKKVLNRTILLIFALLCLKGIAWLWFKKSGNEIPYGLLMATRFQCMLIGGVGAILYFNENQRFIDFATHPFTQIACWFIMFFILINHFHIASIIDNEIVSVVITLIIIAQVTRKNRIVNLENKICLFLGNISYGIYIIHPLVIYCYSQLIGPFQNNSILNYMITFGLVISTTILLAYLSYHFYEQRFLKLKRNYAPKIEA
jgi:peptidoglycan/LPS O-acetylase OafA/YrhL